MAVATGRRLQPEGEQAETRGVGRRAMRLHRPQAAGLQHCLRRILYRMEEQTDSEPYYKVISHLQQPKGEQAETRGVVDGGPNLHHKRLKCLEIRKDQVRIHNKHLVPGV